MKKYIIRNYQKFTKDYTCHFPHDVVGHHLVYNFFKSKEIKVSFGASGADELFGGYEAYKNINWGCNKTKNLSPYSNFKNQKNY